MTEPNASNKEINSEWLAELAKAIRLREGVEGITRSLWALYRGSIDTTRDWSGSVKIPVPVMAALRRELEKRKILVKDKKLQLTSSGKRRLQDLFGQQEKIDSACLSCRGTGRILPVEVYPVIEEFKTICGQRPHVDVTLDQSHATPETGVRKALFLLEKGLLARSIFFMGDDDFISIACMLVRKRFMPESENVGPLTVADIDPRYLDLITDLSGGTIQVRQYDIRDELPPDLNESHSVALTDPAYTVNGITAFSYRCRQALEQNGTLLLSMPFPDGENLNAIQKNLIDMGFALREIHPGFNRYHGASMHANQTNLIIAEKIGSPPEKSFLLRYTPLYTGELRPPHVQYICTLCNTVHQVGADSNYLTIHNLKENGCEECGNDVFRRLSSPQPDDSTDPSQTQ